MKLLDGLFEKQSRGIARNSSRRGLLKILGTALVGAASLPLLPVARAEDVSAKRPHDAGDPASCDYWRYCAIDGFLCECCGGTYTTCPPGTEMSHMTWIGTCRNPLDGRNYVISYNDCCGTTQCATCFCQRGEGDRPIYRSDKSNDLNWCLGASSTIYHCTVAVVVGLGIGEK